MPWRHSQANRRVEEGWWVEGHQDCCRGRLWGKGAPRQGRGSFQTQTTSFLKLQRCALGLRTQRLARAGAEEVLLWTPVSVLVSVSFTVDFPFPEPHLTHCGDHKYLRNDCMNEPIAYLPAWAFLFSLPMHFSPSLFPSNWSQSKL